MTGPLTEEEIRDIDQVIRRVHPDIIRELVRTGQATLRLNPYRRVYLERSTPDESPSA